MQVLRLKAIDLNTENKIITVFDSELLVKAYIGSSKAILNSNRSEKTVISDLIDLIDSFKKNIDKKTLYEIEKEISNLKLINGNYSKTVLFD